MNNSDHPTDLCSIEMEGFDELRRDFMDLYYKIHDAPNPQEMFDSLPLKVKRRYALKLFLSETANGGLDQYFWNASGDEWPILMELFTELNANVSRDTLKNCVAVFEDNSPSTDCRTRRAQMQILYDRGTDINQLVDYAVDHDICVKFLSYYNQ